ncbi:MAG: glutamate-cysteine ligase family protein [Patescibacteria group bacterium]
MNNKQQELEMLLAFRRQADEILSNPERFRKDGRKIKIGFESEVALYKNGLPLGELEKTRDEILARVPGFTDKELGAGQMEFRTLPYDILSQGGFRAIESEYRGNFSQLLESARESGCSILRSGTNPFLPVKNTPRTNKLKYQLVPDFYNRHRRPGADTIIGLGRDKVDIGDAAIVSLFQSFQVNLEANSFADALNKANRSLGIAPYLLALFANSRYLGALDTEMQDIRMMSWAKSHDTSGCVPLDTEMQDVRLISWEKAFDTRTEAEIRSGDMLRVGLPEKYFESMEEYLARAGKFPFILNSPENALGIAIGMTWLDARIKFIEDSLVVELRLLPTMPTIDEELLATLLYIGALSGDQKRNRPLLSMSEIRENRISAMTQGMNAEMWFESGGRVAMKIPFWAGFPRYEFPKIKDSLEELGLLQFLDVELLKFILGNGSPSTRLGRAVAKSTENDMVSKFEEAMKDTGQIVS